VLEFPGEDGAALWVQVHYGYLRPKFGKAPAKSLPKDAHSAGDNGGFPR
jgi:hypothetical protein